MNTKKLKTSDSPKLSDDEEEDDQDQMEEKPRLDPRLTMTEEEAMALKNQGAIGQGTFGVVYKALNPRTRQLYAVKRIMLDNENDNREFDLVASLNHKNCVKIHGYHKGSSSSTPREDGKVFRFIVMDYFPESLYKFIRYYDKMSVPFPEALVKIYAYQLIRGLHYLKIRKICHRDIKPPNILVNTKD